MNALKTLNDYTWLVETIRKNQRNIKNLEAAIDAG